MTLRTRLLTLVGALALTLTIAVAAIAAGGPAGALAASGTDPATATGQHPMADFLARLAANLGISQDQLTSAVKQTDLQLIDEAEAGSPRTRPPPPATASTAAPTASRPSGSAAGAGAPATATGRTAHRSTRPPATSG